MDGEAGRFTTGSTLRHVTVMSLTGSVGLAFMFLVDVATLYWVSVLGDPALVAGVGIASAVQYFIIAFGVGLAIAGTALVSRAIGARQREEARRFAASSLALAGLLLGAIAVAVALLAAPLVGLVGAEPGSAAVARDFLLLSAPSLPCFGLAMNCGAILRAEGDALRAMLVTVTAGAVAVVLDPLLILGLGMGADGAALGVTLSRAAAAALGLWLVAVRRGLVARPRRSDLARHLRPFASIALPASLTQLSAPFGNLVLTAVVAGFGDAAVAAWTVAGRLSILAFGGIFAIAGAIGGILGQNFGAGLVARVRAAWRDALLVSTLYTLAVWAVLALTGPGVVTLFRVPEAGADVVLAFTTWTAGAYAFSGALFVANAVFNTLGRPLRSTLLNWLRDAGLAWPLAVALAGPLGATGPVWAQALAAIVMGTAGTWSAGRFLARLAPPAPAGPARRAAA